MIVSEDMYLTAFLNNAMKHPYTLSLAIEPLRLR